MSRRKKKLSDWDTLRVLITDFGDACRADEMKGGGDPTAIPEIEAYLTLALAKLNGHIDRMSQDYGSLPGA